MPSSRESRGGEDASLGIFAGISIVSMSALPVTRDAAGSYATQLGTTYQNDPVLGIVSALHLHVAAETAARDYVGVLAATILVIATNAGLIGISRISWSLSEHRQLPGAFCRLHPRYRTPWFTIAFFSVIAVILLVPARLTSWGTSTASGRCSRSPSRTSRSSPCGCETLRATGPTGLRGTSGSVASPCR
jgi:APA family basic amino acid/polyamine antiporter